MVSPPRLGRKICVFHGGFRLKFDKGVGLWRFSRGAIVILPYYTASASRPCSHQAAGPAGHQPQSQPCSLNPCSQPKLPANAPALALAPSPCSHQAPALSPCSHQAPAPSPWSHQAPAPTPSQSPSPSPERIIIPTDTKVKTNAF